MERLISNTDFGFYVRELEINDHKKLELRESYDLFLKQPLTLGMFIPCDLDGNVLKIIPFNEHKKGSNFEFMQHKLFDEAKDRVLFEGFKQNIYNETGSFEIVNDKGFQICVYKALPKYFLWLGCPKERTVESAIYFNVLFLTPTAQKQIGL